jgi:hypothetical protein
VHGRGRRADAPTAVMDRTAVRSTYVERVLVVASALLMVACMSTPAAWARLRLSGVVDGAVPIVQGASTRTLPRAIGQMSAVPLACTDGGSKPDGRMTVVRSRPRAARSQTPETGRKRPERPPLFDDSGTSFSPAPIGCRTVRRRCCRAEDRVATTGAVTVHACSRAAGANGGRDDRVEASSTVRRTVPADLRVRHVPRRYLGPRGDTCAAARTAAQCRQRPCLTLLARQRSEVVP